MVTGIETAGLVLGAFPLLLQGVGIYLDGSNKVAGLWNWRRQLRTIIREFTVEYSLFTMTCERIFEELGDTESMGGISQLMDGRAEIWRTSDFKARLTKQMGPEIAAIFLREVELLYDLLEDVRKQLGLDGITPEDLEQLKGSEKHPILKKAKLKVIKSILSNSDLLENIKKVNHTLQRFERVAPRRSQPIPAPKKIAAAVKLYKRLRDHAFNLHTVLEEKFAPCECTTLSHTGHLQLLKVVTDNPNLKFTVLFTYNTTKTMSWCEVEFEPIDNPEPESVRISNEPSTPSTEQSDQSAKPKRRSALFPSRTPTLEMDVKKRLGSVGNILKSMVIPSKPKPKSVRFPPPETPQSRNTGDLQGIDNLCQAIQEASKKSGAGKVCELGILDSPKSKCKHRIRSLGSRLSSPYLSEVISLGDLLKYGMLEKERKRFELSVTLATATMQLYGTVWLKDSWGKNEIFFLQTSRRAIGEGGKPIMTQEPVLGKPLVRRLLEPAFSNRRSSSKHDGFLRSLGIILVELFYGKPMTEICSDGTWVEDISKITVSFADDLADRIACDGGQLYACAVRHCIKGIDHDVRSLDNDEFRGKVDTAVVMNLKRHCDAFKEGEELMKRSG
ncbi:hypothetical protein BZA77DRAFT_358336 [Pyronema omphalodes]|nr:hypothetical protein BZA77DRAFT_358336 [Pyronema omphalodes]